MLLKLGTGQQGRCILQYNCWRLRCNETDNRLKYSGMRLNYDILLFVMWHLLPSLALEEHRSAVDNWPAHDIWALMHTCRALYHHGIPILLAFPCRFDACDWRFHFFTKFLLSQPRSFDNLYTLDLRSTKPGYHPVPATKKDLASLCDVLSRASNLKTLRLSLFEDWLELDEDSLSSAMSRLTKLESLSLIGVGNAKRTTGVLQAMVSPLSYIRLSFDRYILDTANFPLSALSNFKDTLLEVKLDLSLASQLPAEIQFPNVRKLHVHEYWHGDLQTLYRCFPKAEEIVFGPTVPCAETISDEDTEQKRRHWQDTPREMWENLDTIVCGYRPLFVSKPLSKVRLWQISDWVSVLSFRPFCFHAVLKDIQPSHIRLRYSPQPERNIYINPNTLENIFPLDSQYITHLDLTVNLYELRRSRERALEVMVSFNIGDTGDLTHYV